MAEIRFIAHPSEDAFEEYAFDRLAEPEVERLEEHLLVCAACQDKLREVDDFIRLTKRAALNLQTRKARPVRQAGFVKNLWGALAAAAAMIAIALFAFPVPPGGKAARVELTAFRGDEMAHAKAGRPLELAIDLSDLAPSGEYRVQVVNALGREEWSGSAAAPAGKVLVHVPKSLSRGVYWVRIASGSGDLLREFGLRLE